MKSKTLNRWNVFRVSKFLSLSLCWFSIVPPFLFFLCAFFVKFFSSLLSQKKRFLERGGVQTD